MVIRVSRQQTEVLGLQDPNLRVSNQHIEVLGYKDFEARVSRQHVEVLGTGDFNSRVSRQQVEVLGIDPPNLRVTRQLIEVMGPVNIFFASASSVLNLQQTNGASTNHITVEYYGTIYEADTYFAQRLHERTWSKSTADDRKRALWAATLIIDALNYKGDKHSEFQYLEFPRDADTEVPEDVLVASYEIAYSLLDGKDPNIELEALGIKSHGFQAESTSYQREQVPIEHIINGVPSSQAWRLLRPYLREDDAIILSRIS